jgi:hypothetical protein
MSRMSPSSNFDTQGAPFQAWSGSLNRAARAAGRGTTWLSHLASPVEKSVEEAAATEVDPLDVVAATNVVAALPELGRPERFDTQVTAARTGLLAADARPYEDSLVYLGILAGAQPSQADGGATVAPDATWIMSSGLWVCWEARARLTPTVSSVRRLSGRRAAISGTSRISAMSRSRAVPSHC